MLRLTLNLSDEVETVLRDLARLREVPISDVLVQALTTERYLDDLLRGGEVRLLAEYADGRMTEIVIENLASLPSAVKEPRRRRFRRRSLP